MQVRILASLVAGCVLSALGNPGGLVAQATLPRLSLVYSSTDIDASPQLPFSPIAVGPLGQVVFGAAPGSDLQLVLLDSTGKVSKLFVRPGEGPGEARTPMPIFVGSRMIGVWDMALMRLTEWGLDGSLQRSTVAKAPGVFIARYGTNYLGLTFSSEGAQPASLDPTNGAVEDLVSRTDSFYRAEFKPLSPTNPIAAVPILGEWSGGFLIASTESYHIGLYERDGVLTRVLSRNVTPSLPSAARVDRQMARMRSVKLPGRPKTEADFAKIRDQLATKPLPAFALAAPIRSDARGRLWVLGVQGDSAFADVFTPERFVGRLGISCPGFEGKWSLSGSWLAMVCAPTDPQYDGDAVVRLFRISETSKK